MSASALPHPSRRALLAGAILCLAGSRLAGAAPDGPHRIVMLGGALTEIAYALGAADRIVAVDTTSLYPAEALGTKASVGYLRQLSAEGILSVRPDLVLAIEGAGPPDALRLVGESGVRIMTVPDLPTEAGVTGRIAAVAEALGQAERGRALAEAVGRRFADLAGLRARIGRPARGLFILSLQNGRALVGGRSTSADGILRLAGIENTAAAIEGFKPMTDEAIVAARPEVVVMMDGGPGGGPPADLFSGAALSQVPAAETRRLVTMNGLALLGFGPRTPDAARDLMEAVYPALRTP